MDTVLQSRTLDQKPIAPSLFAHFVLRSSNMPVMVDWYSTVLNMHVVQRNDFICFLTYDNEHHRLAIVNVEGLHEPDAKAWGMAHVAYTFRDIGELLSTWRALSADPSRPDDIAVLSRSRRQFSRAAGRSLQDERGMLGLLHDRRLPQESDRRCLRSGGARCRL